MRISPLQAPTCFGELLSLLRSYPSLPNPYAVGFILAPLRGSALKNARELLTPHTTADIYTADQEVESHSSEERAWVATVSEDRNSTQSSSLLVRLVCGASRRRCSRG